MLIIGIETSNLIGSVALIRDAQCLAEIQLNQAGRRHAQSLVMEIGELLRLHGLTARDVNAVAVSRGPGSFTGLRVGMTCAKTFAYATGCQFIAVDTFEAIAANLPLEATRVHIVEDAQRDELFAGEYFRNVSGDWERSSPIQIISVSNFLNQIKSSEIITGPGTRKLKLADGTLKILSEPEFWQARASVIATLGERQLLSTPKDPVASNSVSVEQDFWKALPFYLRLSAAEEKRISTQTTN